MTTSLAIGNTMARLGGYRFSPAALFSSGEQGAWFDPSDLSTMFNDAAGTQPITSFTTNQPVGLLLDKSKGLALGPELVTNGNFSQGTTGWTAGIGWSVGSGIATHASGTSSAINQTGSITGGKTYICTVTVSGRTAGSWYWRLGNTSNLEISNLNGTITKYIVAPATGNYIGIFGDASFDGSIDNISVRELPGNHATASGSARPVLSKRYNLLTRTEEFNDGVWAKAGLNAFGSGSVANTNATTDPIGGNTADFIQENTANTQHYVNTAFGTPAISTGVLYTQVFYAKPAGRDIVYVQNAAAGTGYGGAFITLSGAGSVSNYFNGLTSGVSVRSVGTGWYEIVMQFTAANTNGSCIFAMSNALGTQTYTGDGTSGIYIWGADLRRTIDANAFQPAYQRVVTATDYDGDGFLPYLEFGGTQYLTIGGSASAMKFLHSDVSSVCTGVNIGNSSDPNTFSGLYGSNGSSASNIGNAFWYDDRVSLTRNNAAVQLITAGGGNTVVSTVDPNTLLPITPNVVFTYQDPANATAANRYSLYVNGSAPLATNASTVALSTSNSTFDVQIGALGNNVGPAIMRYYGMLMVNSTISAPQRTALQSWMAQRTGVAL